MFRTLFQLPSTVWLLGLISFFNDTAGELVYSLLPLYVTSVLMAGPKVLGLIEGISEATGSLLKLISGILYDRSGSAKKWIIAGYSFAGISRPLLAFVNSWPIVLLLRVGDRFGKGLRTSPRDALLSLSVPPEKRGVAFGLHRAFDNLGAVIGPLLAAGMLSRQLHVRQILLWVAIPGFLTVLLTFLIREPERIEVVKTTPFSWNLKKFPAVYKRYLLVLALFTLGNSSNTFLLLRAKGLGLSDAEIPIIWALVWLMASLFSTPLSALSDRIGRSHLIIFGWGVYGLFYFFLGSSSITLWSLWPLFAFYGLFLAATEGVEKAMVADLVLPSQIGTAFGWFHLITGLMLFPSSFLFGWLWQSWNPELAFSFSAGCALIASLLLKFWVV